MGIHFPLRRANPPLIFCPGVFLRMMMVPSPGSSTVNLCNEKWIRNQLIFRSFGPRTVSCAKTGVAAREKTASPKAILIIFLSQLHLSLVLLSFFIRCPLTPRTGRFFVVPPPAGLLRMTYKSKVYGWTQVSPMHCPPHSTSQTGAEGRGHRCTLCIGHT